MGISGLLPFLQKSSRRANIREYSGATVAIDAYCWLHKGAFACAEKLVMKEPTTMYVTYCMKYVNMLLSHNIKPILVFDGQNLPAKAQTEVKRRQNRDVNRRKGMELMRAGRVAEGRMVLRRALDVTHAMALEVIRECRRRNVDCIVAPYEADAQLAYLSLQGIAHVIITEDSDLMLFGCKTVMFKMDVNGNGVIVESDKLHVSMGLRTDNFSFDKFRLMCILSGCDYLDSLPGIGLSKACKFVNRTSESDVYRALEKLPANLNMWTLEVTDEYRHAVLAADLTFRCQLVFDPLQRRQVPLTQPREDELPVGEIKDSPTALQLALGNLDPRNLQQVDNFDPDKPEKPRSRAEEAMRAPHASIWKPDYTRSARPKEKPSIMRLATAGKTVHASVPLPPAAKREVYESDDGEEDEVDLLSLYGGSKRPKTALLDQPLQSSRYFNANQQTNLGKTSFLDQLKSTPPHINESSPLEDESEELISDMDLFCEPDHEYSPSLDSVMDKMENITTCSGSGESSSSQMTSSSSLSSQSLTDVISEPITSSTDSALVISSHSGPSLPLSVISDTPSDPPLPRSTLNKPDLPFCSTPTLPFIAEAKTNTNVTLPLRATPSATPKSALRAFQFKLNDSKGSPSRMNGLASLDTVGTDRSVFFSGSSPLPTISRVPPKKLRAGLSRRKSSPQQSVLSKFGFQILPKIGEPQTKAPTI